jgi:hypothetical protein
VKQTLSLFFMLIAIAVGRDAGAQTTFQFLGPNECLNCHDHNPEREWYEKKEIPEVRRLFPDRGDKAGHINSLNQMETPKSDEFAKAIGLADKYDINGKCVSCHATVFRGDANAGVSCESCHGPGSGYMKPHQTKDAYEVSVSQYGMTRLIGNIQGWTQQCTNCHVMDDDRLIKAGHPSGDDFDLSKKYVPVSLHFKKKYTEDEVATVAKAQMAAILHYRRTGSPPPVETSAAPAPAVPAPPPPPPPVESAAPATATPDKPATPPVPPPPIREAAKPKPAPAKTPVPREPAAPPPGSPTSIEPRFPLPQAAAPAAAATQPAAARPPASPLPPAEEPIETSTLVLGGIGLLALIGAAWFFLSRSR